MIPPSGQPTLGVVGGLGPLASAEFVRTIYAYGAEAVDVEQSMPAVVLFSDPRVPDRTAALANDTSHVLLDCLQTSVEQLLGLGCSHVVVCCVTMHAVIPELSEVLRERIVSLIDVAIDEVIASGERQVLFCSSGTRRMRLFERHPRWRSVERLVRLPDPADQERIHGWIYDIKRTGDARPHVAAATALLEKYGACGPLVGCTEFHLLTRAARACGLAWRSCDPLDTIARIWAATGAPPRHETTAAIHSESTSARSRPRTSSSAVSTSK
jgi:aspartate racemase